LRAAATTAATTALLHRALAGPALRLLASTMATLPHPTADAVAAPTYRFIGASPNGVLPMLAGGKAELYF